MNRYLKWTDKDIVDLKQILGCAVFWTEVDGGGMVLRELGFTENGICNHKVDLAECSHNALFDTAVIDLNNSPPSQMSDEEFVHLWENCIPPDL